MHGLGGVMHVRLRGFSDNAFMCITGGDGMGSWRRYTVGVGPADAEALEGEARRRRVSVSEVIRIAIQEHLARDAEHRVIPLLEEAMAPHVDRLAALIAKTYFAAAVAAWQSNYLIAITDKEADPVDIMREANIRARVDMSRKGSEIGGATEEEYQTAVDAAQEAVTRRKAGE